MQIPLYQAHAVISAQIVEAFAPIIRSARETDMRFYDGSLFTYPVDGGVLVMATDGRVMAAMLDRDGKADKPAQILLPDRILDACVAPKPIVASYEGEEFPFALPDWAQPEKVHLDFAGAVVHPKASHPDDGDSEGVMHVLASTIAESGNVYRDDQFRIQEPRFDPRKVFDVDAPAKAAVTSIAPSILALFEDAARLFNKGASTELRFRGEAQSALVLFQGCPDFLGLAMPMNCRKPLPVPTFFAPIFAPQTQEPV